eukprot:4733385-Amphidinium_carterae.1
MPCFAVFHENDIAKIPQVKHYKTRDFVSRVGYPSCADRSSTNPGWVIHPACRPEFNQSRVGYPSCVPGWVIHPTLVQPVQGILCAFLSSTNPG